MAGYVMKDLVRKAGLEAYFEITSGAVSDEEWGNPIYPPAQRKLREKGVPFGHHSAHKISATEFDDPWYTGDFEKTYQDVLAGCSALLEMVR